MVNMTGTLRILIIFMFMFMFMIEFWINLIQVSKFDLELNYNALYKY